MIHILFSASSDFIPHALVTAVSAAKRLSGSEKLCVHFMYADIVKKINPAQREDFFALMQTTLENLGVAVHFYDVEPLLAKFKGQNIGMWGENISLTHYMYLLAPEVIKEDKVIYIDTDMIVNTDLSVVFRTDMKNCLLGMGAPRGQEDMGNDVCNSGFVVLNLNLWRKENTLDDLLAFGKKLPKSNYCDQNLLYQYFTKNHKNRLFLFEKEYNLFPQIFVDTPLSDIKILHYTGWGCIKPWYDFELISRGSRLWWYYAQQTPFYMNFIKEKDWCPQRKLFGKSRHVGRGLTVVWFLYFPVMFTKKTLRIKYKKLFGIVIENEVKDLLSCRRKSKA